MEKKIKPKKCKNCKELFQVVQFNQKYCFAPECLKIWIYEANLKDWNKRKPILKKSIETSKSILVKAQKIFNLWIRKRDEGLNCISCNKVIKEGNCDAGHLWSAGGHANVRFNELNVNSQCSRPCNKDLSGDPNNYRIGFIRKYGIAKLEYLDSIAHAEKKYSIEELEEIIEKYKIN